MSNLTYELTIRISDGAPEAVTKGAVIERLRAMGYHDVVEGVINGTTESLPSVQDEEALFAALDDRHMPMLIYSADREALTGLSASLNAEFSQALVSDLIPLPNDAWQSAWDESRELVTTEKFVMTPRSVLVPITLPGKIHLPLASDKGFGCGRHAATHSLLSLLETLPPKNSLLDCGTGTGILAIAATFLGYRHITATDIDADVLEEARANALGLSVREISWHLTAVPPLGPYDLIVANILTPVLHDLMEFFSANLAPDGTVLLSGFIAKEKGVLLAAARRYGLEQSAEASTRSWLAIALKKNCRPRYP